MTRKPKNPRRLYANNEAHKKEFLEALQSELPPFIARKDIERFLGGIVTTKTMSNMDAQGDGPEVAYAVGRNVVYRREDLLAWFGRRYAVQRLENVNSFSAV